MRLSIEAEFLFAGAGHNYGTGLNGKAVKVLAVSGNACRINSPAVLQVVFGSNQAYG